MSGGVVVRVENLWKQYRYGAISHATLRKDIQSWWARIRGKEDPNLPIRSDLPSSNSTLDGDRFWALSNVSFEVHRGDVLGIIGKNGAGKSTLLKIMSRVTTPTKGEIKVKHRVASLLEVGTGFHPELTGRENIFLNGAILGMTKNEIRKTFDQIVAFAEVERFIDTPVKRYSSGMYVRLAFAVAAHLNFEILIVDEVLAMGDAAFQKKCLGKMSEVGRGGRTVIFVSHNMAAVSQLTNRCLVLNQGLISFDGSTTEAIRHYGDEKKLSGNIRRVSVDKLHCDYQWVSSPTLRIAELGLAEGQAEEISIGDDLRLEVLLESQLPFQDLHFGYSINEEISGTVLSGFSPAFDIPGKGSHLRQLSINALNLAPGDYTLNISVGTGSIFDPKYVYSGILGFGRFTVRPVMRNANIADWNKSWGMVIHTSSSVDVRSLEVTPAKDTK